MDIFQTLFGEMHAMTDWEIIAVALALAYLILAMKENIWCWPAAFFSSAIYMIIFWEVSLLMESVLSFYYIGMAVYGFWVWTKGGNEHQGVNVVSWSASKHFQIIAITGLISIIVGYLMAKYTSASFPYLDAATTCFAVMTTYLVAQKVLENWLYWMVINSVSIYLYLNKGLILTSVLFVMYLILAVIGYYQWRKSMQSAQSIAS
ncbi:nicotinamide riboside transporter PnuC [Parashewanella spongiae]|uniref:Nicotinamide riboside transporter PnuC n=1 Tax=Parashewanella spongiae TaxID=342950 RepID=A0A3A6TVK0_9GAMM|nr:nicotinamide riboside transporter PnuC [Parashewanella spongiae]MCL1077962.1 nicotinamide riboside transporter PnuC [Parashewanella spongiae]RJY16913.1 nicotinamide riboside transporter PnuC [Parashewanella spongiae]